ncbi:hypothetical protein [Streptomyces sp. NPDC056524]|uniref:hypothetical protein n=1 Tax=Streptomyces sp. NPDC056524 TaxID=3345851 RepID=UPI00368133B7
MSLVDSDVGFIEALTPDGSSWEGLLNREMAKSYEIPLDQSPSNRPLPALSPGRPLPD